MTQNNAIERYARQTVLPQFGTKGQTRLHSTSALIVGVGGLGSVVSLYLCAAGIGKLSLVDPDIIAESNLQRQILYRTSQIGKQKVEQAQKSLHDLNPNVEIEFHALKYEFSNAVNLSKGHDIIIDGTDNAQTRYLMNDVSIGLNIPYIFGAISDFLGQISVFNSATNSAMDSATYRCLFPELPETPDLTDKQNGNSSNGVLGCLPGVIGCMEVNEAIKTLCGMGNTLQNKLYSINLLDMQSQIYSIKARSEERKLALENFYKMARSIPQK
ncbi:MAG: HesA/MoeB/ThiF family protein [Bacteroidales bacterium]